MRDNKVKYCKQSIRKELGLLYTKLNVLGGELRTGKVHSGQDEYGTHGENTSKESKRK